MGKPDAPSDEHEEDLRDRIKDLCQESAMLSVDELRAQIAYELLPFERQRALFDESNQQLGPQIESDGGLSLYESLKALRDMQENHSGS